ncbi:hypothetical protein H4R19_003797 [Coemansia spiralis]|nr:hypothetical protein H4R19_003797 [Coemansia spiralis]
MALSEPLRPSQLTPKAARLLGLASPRESRNCDGGSGYPRRRSFSSSRSDSSSGTGDGLTGGDQAQALLLTPVSLRSVDSSTGSGSSGGSTWVPDWPEPDDEYVETMMMKRRPAVQAARRSRSASGDPLAVWHQPAALPRMAGVPAGATNAWRRRHGLQWPLDPLLVAQWAASLGLSGGYFALVRPLSQLALGARTAHPAFRALDIVGAVAVVAALVLSAVTSLVDPQAPEAADGAATRDLCYQQRWGAPAIDPQTLVCRVCCVQTRPATRHCKRCNKCVARLDHHCRYLGTCIGARNYPWFFAATCAANIALASVLARAVHAVYVSGWQKVRFIALVYQLTAIGPEDPDRDPAGGLRAPAAMCALAVYACVAAASTVFIAMLLALHVRLCLLNTTTIEYEAMRGRDRDQSDLLLLPCHSPAAHRPQPARARSTLRSAARAVRLLVARTLRRTTSYRPVSTGEQHPMA